MKKIGIEKSALWPCRLEAQTTAQVLQSCPLHKRERESTRPTESSLGKRSLPDYWTSTDHQRGNNWRNRSHRSDCWTVDLCQWGSRSFSCHLATNSGARRRPWGMGGRACSLDSSSHFERKWGWSYWTLVIFLCCIFHFSLQYWL